MTARIRHEPTGAALTAGFGQPHSVTVTLPAPPWGNLDHDDRAATAPTARTVRYSGPLDALKYDPILRSAAARKDKG
jgi:hypothetical protein